MKTILDLFCGEGGGSWGYDLAGFKVTGVDINKKPDYPYRFIQADALTLPPEFLQQYDAIHASPECQNHCWSTKRWRNLGKEYNDQLEPTRALLIASGKPYVIENVPTAPLINPTYLDGTMFGLGVIRRRGFETSGWWIPKPMGRKRKKPIMQQNKKDPRIFIKKSAYCSVTGNGSGGWSCRVKDWRDAMGIDWMTRTGIKQAIPPAYTEYVGRYLMGVV